MSGELTTTDYRDETALAGYLSELQVGAQDEQLAGLALEANPFEVMPKLKLSKDTREIRAVQNDETVATFSARNPLFFVAVLMAESRALWRPDTHKRDDEDDKRPVCSTPRLPIGTFRRDNDKGVGTWRAKDNMDLTEDWHTFDGDVPDEQTVECRSCPLNRFGSVSDWDASREGRGKACGEGRLLVGYFCSKIAEMPNGLGIFDFDPNGPMVYLEAPATSIGAIKKMGTACVARRVPARYSVFTLSCDNKKNGQLQWGELSQEFSGYIARERIKDADDGFESLKEIVLQKQVGPDIESGYGDDDDDVNGGSVYDDPPF